MSRSIAWYNESTMFENPVSLIVVLVIVNIPLYVAVGWFLFRTWEDFFEAIRYALIPDFLSLFTGELAEDWWAEIRLGILTAVSVAAVWGEYALLSGWLVSSGGTS